MQDALLGTEDRGRLGHEVDAAERDQVLLDLGGPLGEPERVADVVGHVLDLGQLVVVGEDDGAALARELAHLGLQRRDALEGQGHVGGRGDGERLAHGSGSRMRDRSRAGAECVRAPTEMKSTPVSAISRTVSRLTPPLASSSARPRVRSTAARSWTGRHVVEQDARRAGVEGLVELADRRGPRPPAGRPAPRRALRRRPPPPRRPATMWFSLMRIASKSPIRWFVAPAGRHGGLLEAAQPGRGLARVEDPGAGPRDRVDVARVSVAIPDRRRARLSAVRSAESSGPRAARSIASTGPPSRQSPSAPSRSNVAAGSRARKARLGAPGDRRPRRAPSA